MGAGKIAAKQLSALKVEDELRLVPGRAGITGNEMADRAANSGARQIKKERTTAGTCGREGLGQLSEDNVQERPQAMDGYNANQPARRLGADISLL